MDIASVIVVRLTPKKHGGDKLFVWSSFRGKQMTVGDCCGVDKTTQRPRGWDDCWGVLTQPGSRRNEGWPPAEVILLKTPAPFMSKGRVALAGSVTSSSKSFWVADRLICLWTFLLSAVLTSKAAYCGCIQFTVFSVDSKWKEHFKVLDNELNKFSLFWESSTDERLWLLNIFQFYTLFRA